MTLRDEASDRTKDMASGQSPLTGYDSHRRSPGAQYSEAAIAEQTARFLRTGGKVQQIPIGVSGEAKRTYGKRPRVDIVLGSAKQRAAKESAVG